MIKQIWFAHIKVERETEQLRQSLLRNAFFDIQKAFKTIDWENKGYITSDDVRYTLIDYF